MKAKYFILRSRGDTAGNSRRPIPETVEVELTVENTGRLMVGREPSRRLYSCHVPVSQGFQLSLLMKICISTWRKIYIVIESVLMRISYYLAMMKQIYCRGSMRLFSWLFRSTLCVLRTVKGYAIYVVPT
jgi:hypothetical protein